METTAYPRSRSSSSEIQHQPPNVHVSGSSVEVYGQTTLLWPDTAPNVAKIGAADHHNGEAKALQDGQHGL